MNASLPQKLRSRITGALLLLTFSTWGGESPLTNQGACCTKAPPSTATDRSIYQVTSSWSTDAGRPIELGELQGRVQLITMFFASCEYACPVLVHDMRRIESALPEAVRSNVNFVLVSFDSERDTPATLREYRKRHELDPAHWTLLHGQPDDVLELAALLGVKFKKDARGQFVHSNVITLLNKHGEIIHQQVGLNQPPDATVKRIVGALGMH